MAEATEPVTNMSEDQIKTEAVTTSENDPTVKIEDNIKNKDSIKSVENTKTEGEAHADVAEDVTQDATVEGPKSAMKRKKDVESDGEDESKPKKTVKVENTTDSTKKRKKAEDSDDEEEMPKKSAKVTKADGLAEDKKDDAAEGETTAAPIAEVTMAEGEAQAGAAIADEDGGVPHDKSNRGPRQHSMPVRKIRSTFDHLEESRDPDEIRAQVEFYLSDSNLPGDKHMLHLTGGHQNKPIDVGVFHSFKRMKHFQPRSAIVDALKDSTFLDISDDGGITRKVPLDKKYGFDVQRNKRTQLEDNMSRSVYVKGFGREVDTTHHDIEKYFAPYGPVKSIRLRRWEDGEFKGSVFVEFGSEQLQKQFLAVDPLPHYQGRDNENRDMVKKSLKEYVEHDCDNDVDRIIDPYPDRSRKNGAGHRGGYHHPDRDVRRKGPSHQHRNRDERDRTKPARGNGRGGRGGRNEQRRHNDDRYDREDKTRRDADKGYKGDRSNFGKRREHEEKATREEAESYETKDLKADDAKVATAQGKDAQDEAVAAKTGPKAAAMEEGEE